MNKTVAEIGYLFLCLNMIQQIIGQKIDQIQGFLTDGTRIPVTVVSVPAVTVISHKTKEKNGYLALQVGFGTRKKATKALLGQVKGAKQEKAPFLFQEIKVKDEDLKEVGSAIAVHEVLKPGDIIDVIGTSKGKGYAGVVKRHHFKGGPRTHGQSDRERAPGSIGQTTTPGRVYKGKKMAGRMGSDRVTIKNLEVIGVEGDTVFIKGLVPGSKKSVLTLTRTGEVKHFVPLYKKEEDQPVPLQQEKEDVSTEQAVENKTENAGK